MPQHEQEYKRELRRQAEGRVESSYVDVDSYSPDELKALVHELRVHQIELEIQNEELRRSQDELTRTQKDYSDLYHFAPVGYVSLNDKGMIRMANQAFAQLVASDLDQLSKSHFFRFVRQDQQREFIAWMTKTRAGEASSHEVQLLQQGKPGPWVQVNARPGQNKGQAQEQTENELLLTVTDISERHEMRRKLEETLSHLDTAINVGNLAWWQMDATSGQVIFHEHKARMLGYPPERFWGKGYQAFTELLHPDDYDGAMQAMRDHIEGGKDAYECEYRIQSWQGDWVWFYDYGRVTKRTEYGRPWLITGIVMDITQRKHAEAELVSSEKRFRTLFEMSNDGIVVVDPQKRTMLFANQRWLDLTGYERGEIDSVTLPDLLPQEEVARHLASFERLKNGDVDYLYNAYIKRKDGSFFYADLSAYLVVVEGEEQIVGMFRDTTERYRAEKELKRSESFRRLILNSAADPMFIINYRTMRFVECNSEAARSLGWGQEELLSMGPADIKPEYTEWELAELFAEVLDKNDRSELFETLHQRKDGTRFPVEIHLRAAEYEGQTIFIVTARDMTERKVAEANLLESEDRFRRIFADSAIGMVLCTPAGEFIRVNRAFCRITGYSEQELLAMTFQEMTHPEDLARQEEYTRKLLQQEITSYQLEKRYLTQEQEVIWVLLTVSLLTDISGRPRYFAGQVQDITEQKKAAHDLEIAVQRAEAASRAKANFLANMSHEIRTPMNGVLGILRLLQDSSLSTEARGLVDMAYKSAESLLTIINDILDFSKIEAGKLHIEYMDFDLKQLLYEVYSLLKFNADDKGLAFHLSYELAQDVFFYGDPARIRQIIMNIAGNALKFTEEGSVTIKAFGQERDRHQGGIPPRNVVITIADTGVGISEEHLKNIFNLFEQADTSTTRKFGGTGLGLSISKQLAELMGGTIEVASTLGEGSSFSVKLPLETRQSKALQGAAQPTPEEGRSSLLPRHIYVVEDIEFYQNIQQNLESIDCIYRYNVHFVPNLELAQEEVVGLGHGIEAEGFFVLVVVSNEKQKDSVHDMLSRLQQLDWLRLRLLFVSPSGYRGQAEKLRQKGFHGYLAKPFHLGLFWEMACELIQRPEEDFAHTILTRHSLSDSGPKTVEGSEQGQESGEVWPCPGKVLLVEDNSVNQIVAKRMLEKMGCDVEVAGNGQEALDALKRDPEVYSLVFMDIQMPIMDGYEATRRLRALQSRSSRLPIVAMTAGALQEDKESSLEVGMDDYLAKPIKWDDLKEILYKWTAKASE